RMHRLNVRQLRSEPKANRPARIQIIPMAVSHWVTWMARQDFEDVVDLGVRRKTPSRCTSPWIQARVTAQPRLKKLYMVATAIPTETLNRLRKTQMKRRMCRKRKTAGIISTVSVNGRTLIGLE